MNIARDIQRRKQSLCVAPEFPGSPSDYTYTPEKCTPKRRGAQRTIQPPVGAQRNGAQPPVGTQAQLRRELAAVRAKLADYVEPPEGGPLNPQVAVVLVEILKRFNARIVALFKSMIQPTARTRHHDPIARFNHLARNDVASTKPTLMNKVFTLLEIHLESVLMR